MKSFTSALIASFVLLGAAASVFGHAGSRVWIGNVNGQVATYTSDNDVSPTTYEPFRLFATELEDLLGIFTTEFPGFEVRRDGNGNVAAGTTFGFNIAGPLLYYDDVTTTFITVDEAFGPPQPGPVPQLALAHEMDLRVTAAAPVGGFDFYTFNAIGDHSHVDYTLLGDGVAAGGGPAGVYALPLQLTSNALATSELFFLLIGKEVSSTDPLFLEAVEVAEATLLPGLPGDLNCDDVVDVGDAPLLAQALTDPDGYIAAWPDCHLSRADVNEDGFADGRDIQALMQVLLP
ncbi:MAG: dockerin type I repeat-containing protein [Phycisphaerae bacterium]